MRLLIFTAAVVAFAGTAHAQSLAEQTQCAAQAKTEYQEFLAEWRQPNSHGGELQSSNYESHYNVKLKRCLMLLSLTDYSKSTQNLSDTVLLFDAFEHRDYASYSRIIGRDKTPDTLMVCTLTPTNSDTLYCKTRAEFDAYVTRYMED
jgi:hypothetical protein